MGGLFLLLVAVFGGVGFVSCLCALLRTLSGPRREFDMTNVSVCVVIRVSPQ